LIACEGSSEHTVEKEECKMQNVKCKMQIERRDGLDVHNLHFAFCILHFALCTVQSSALGVSYGDIA
jgi:hypothetical protein